MYEVRAKHDEGYASPKYAAVCPVCAHSNVVDAVTDSVKCLCNAEIKVIHAEEPEPASVEVEVKHDEEAMEHLKGDAS